MSRRHSRFWPSVAVMVVGVTGLAGCRSPEPQATPSLMVGTADLERTKLTPNQTADVQVAYARSLEKRGLIGPATAAYEGALKQDPHRVDALVRLAILSDQQGKFAQSLALYQKALAVRPGDPDLFCDMGYSLSLQHRWQEAAMNFRQAVALAPGHQRAHVNLGLVLVHLGRSSEALAEFGRGGCNTTDAQLNLAYGLLLERQYPQAREAYLTALAQDPTSAPARNGLRDLDKLAALAGATPSGPGAVGPTPMATPNTNGKGGPASAIQRAGYASPPFNATPLVPALYEEPSFTLPALSPQSSVQLSLQ